MEQALLICGRGGDKLKALTTSALPCQTAAALSGSEARRMTGERGFSLVMINAPLPDESGLELAMELCQRSASTVILLVKAELMSMVFTPATEAGVLVVSKPLNPLLLNQAIQLGMAMSNRLMALGRENEKLQTRLEEIRTVDRAKCLLIQHMHITEGEAHRAIEKQAMDARLSKLRVAKEIIGKFEL